MQTSRRLSEPPTDQAALTAINAAGWPSDLPVSTYALITDAARRRGTAPALSFFLETGRHQSAKQWSFVDYLEQVNRAANLFHRLDITPDKVVALILPNLPETCFCLWGAEAAGIAQPINPLLEPDGIAGLLRASGAEIVVTVAPFPGVDLYDKALAAIEAAPAVRHLVTVDLADHVSGWKRWPARVAQARHRGAARRPRPGVRVTRYAQAIRGVSGDRLESGRLIRSDDTASMFGTGGTTGAPKLARRTHANEVANAFMSTRMLGSALSERDVMFAGLPMFHVNGAIVTSLAPLFCGASVLMGTPQGYRGEGVIPKFWDIVAEHRVSAFSAVPTLLSALLRHPPQGQDLSHFKLAICGAAPLSAELVSQFEAATGVTILEGYGLTEATCTASLNPLGGGRKIGSVGLPLPFQDVRIAILDADDTWTRDAQPGETGALALSGPNLFQGYLVEEHNRGLWLTDPEGRRWLNTGDLGALDEDGFLWLRGRTKDLIIRGGHNIDPAMIEDAFYAHPSVALAGAVGRPDSHAGEVPVVYVELKPGETVSALDLLAFVEDRISERAARPKDVVIVPSLPLTAVGKVFKPALRQMEAARDAT